MESKGSSLFDRIEEVKIERYRPCVVAVLVCNRTVALFSPKKYPAFEFIQGGIDPGENFIDTIEREVLEEAGKSFYESCNFPVKDMEFLYEARMKMEVKDRIAIEDEILVKPVGKHYFVFALNINTSLLPKVSPTEAKEQDTSIRFNKVKWCNSILAKKLSGMTANQMKRDLALHAINVLANRNWID